MHTLLNHPAVQAFLAPFLLALLSAELLQRLRLSGLAIIIGFAATAYLVSGFAFEPLTSARKIILLGLASGAITIALTLFNSSLWRPLLTTLAGAAAVWVCMRVLQQQPMGTALQWGAGCALYVAWVVFWMDTLHDSPARAASAGMALGLGTGLAVLVGASALLGQLGLALGAAAMAYLLIMMISNSLLPCGRTFTLPLALIAGLLACLAVLTAHLPWYALPVLAAIPLAARLPVSEKLGVWVQSTLLSVAALLFAAGAVYLSWRVNGLPPFLR